MGDRNNESLPGLVKHLEEESIDPRTLDKALLRECAVFLKSRKYANKEISYLLKVDIRTIQRYIKISRQENRLELGEYFHADIVGEIVNNMRLRCQRLWRLADSGKLSPFEEARVMSMIDQIELNEAALLMKLGYLQESHGKEAYMKAYDESVEKREQQEALRLPWICDKRLPPEQIDFIRNYYTGEKHVYPHKVKELLPKINMMVDQFVRENEWYANKLKNVAQPGEIHCRVFVINVLGKN